MSFRETYLAENLVLDTCIEVEGNVVQYLSDFQLRGIRFLYKHFKKDESCILNYDSGHGKRIQVAVLLQALNTSLLKRCLILCTTAAQKDRWSSVFAALTDITVSKVNGKNFDEKSVAVSLLLPKDEHLLKELKYEDFDYLIFDIDSSVTTQLVNSKQLDWFSRSKCTKKVILASIHFKHLSTFTLLQAIQRIDVSLAEFNEITRKDITVFIRSYFLRRPSDPFVKQYPVDLTDLATRKQSNAMHLSEDILFGFKHQKFSHQSTDHLQMLIVSSEEEAKSCPYEVGGHSQFFTTESPAPFNCYSQKPSIAQQNCNAKAVGFNQKEIITSTPTELKLSDDVELINEIETIVSVSSREEQDQKDLLTSRSPDLFECSQSSMDDVLLSASPVTSSPALSLIPASASQQLKSNRDVFEISTNNVFPSLLRVNSDNEMSPICIPQVLSRHNDKPIVVPTHPSTSSPKSPVTPTRLADQKILPPAKTSSRKSDTSPNSNWISRNSPSSSNTPKTLTHTPSRRRNLSLWYGDTVAAMESKIKKMKRPASSATIRLTDTKPHLPRKSIKIIYSSDDER